MWCMLNHFSLVPHYVTPWTAASQAPLSVGFSRQEYWSELPCPSPEDLPSPGFEPVFLTSPALAGGFVTTSTIWEAPSGQFEWPKTLHNLISIQQGFKLLLGKDFSCCLADIESKFNHTYSSIKEEPLSTIFFTYPTLWLNPVFVCLFNRNVFILIGGYYFTILYWFCHTLTWIRHGCTCVPHPEPPSHLPLHTIPLGHPSAPAPSTLYHASNLNWRFVSHMIIYMFQCHSPISPRPRPLPQSPKDCSIQIQF